MVAFKNTPIFNSLKAQWSFIILHGFCRSRAWEVLNQVVLFWGLSGSCSQRSAGAVKRAWGYEICHRWLTQVAGNWMLAVGHRNLSSSHLAIPKWVAFMSSWPSGCKQSKNPNAQRGNCRVFYNLEFIVTPTSFYWSAAGWVSMGGCRARA